MNEYLNHARVIWVLTCGNSVAWRHRAAESSLSQSLILTRWTAAAAAAAGRQGPPAGTRPVWLDSSGPPLACSGRTACGSASAATWRPHLQWPEPSSGRTQLHPDTPSTHCCSSQNWDQEGQEEREFHLALKNPDYDIADYVVTSLRPQAQRPQREELPVSCFFCCM